MRPTEKKLYRLEISIAAVLLVLTAIGVLKIIDGSLIALPLSVLTGMFSCMILEDADRLKEQAKQRDGLRSRDF